MKIARCWRCKLFILAAMLASTQVKADEPSQFSVLPGAIHLEGVGNIAGAAVQAKHVGADDVSVLAGVALGDAQAGLLSVDELPWAGGRLSLSTVLLADITLDTQYQRGTDTGTRYQQSLSGLAQFASLKKDIDQRHHWYAKLGLSLISFEGYADAHGKAIAINQAGLHDVFSTMLALGVSHDPRTLTPAKVGMQANIELAASLFRPGQSDQGQLNYALSYVWPFMGQHQITTYARGSHGFVLAKETAYDDVSEVLAEINGQCTSAACTQLENDLANYIVAANKNGNGQALGGAYGLRSYSEQYIKAANTLLEGVELTLTLPWAMAQGHTLELVAFAEAGQASDAITGLGDDSLYSLGGGVRLNLDDLPIRLEAAFGSDDSQAWFLTAGKRW